MLFLSLTSRKKVHDCLKITKSEKRKISQSLHKIIFAGVYLKETLSKVFYYELCEVFITFFI